MAVYLDYNATTPVLPQVREAVLNALVSYWGNPSSGHALGRSAGRALEKARRSLSILIGAGPEECIFVSGGTEANNTVILGVPQLLEQKGKHIVSSEIEHPSVLNPLIHLAEKGWEVTFVPVEHNGIVDPQRVTDAIREDTVLVSVMLANNETGAIQPVAEIAGIARKAGVAVHTDAAQAVGKIRVDVKELGVDYLTVAGHKLYAPKGIGALYVRSGAPMAPLFFGAGQESGRRPGTEPVPLAVGLGAACDLALTDLDQEARRQGELRDFFWSLLKGLSVEVRLNSVLESCLPNTLSVAFPGINAGALLERLPGVMASTGAACHDRSVSVSHVLAAMGRDRASALGTVRFSIGRLTSKEDIENAVEDIGGVLGRSLRGINEVC